MHNKMFTGINEYLKHEIKPKLTGELITLEVLVNMKRTRLTLNKLGKHLETELGNTP